MSRNARTCFVDKMGNAAGESGKASCLHTSPLVGGLEGENGAEAEAISQNGHPDEVILYGYIYIVGIYLA